MTTSTLNQGNIAVISYAKNELNPDELKQFMLVYPNRTKTVSTGLLLSLLLGLTGAHKFWLGENGAAITYLILGTVGWALIVPPFIIGILCIVDACNMSKSVDRANMSTARALVEEFKVLR